MMVMMPVVSVPLVTKREANGRRIRVRRSIVNGAPVVSEGRHRRAAMPMDVTVLLMMPMTRMHLMQKVAVAAALQGGDPRQGLRRGDAESCSEKRGSSGQTSDADHVDLR